MTSGFNGSPDFYLLDHRPGVVQINYFDIGFHGFKRQLEIGRAFLNLLAGFTDFLAAVSNEPAKQAVQMERYEEAERIRQEIERIQGA